MWTQGPDDPGQRDSGVTEFSTSDRFLNALWNKILENPLRVENKIRP